MSYQCVGNLVRWELVVHISDGLMFEQYLDFIAKKRALGRSHLAEHSVLYSTFARPEVCAVINLS